MEFLLVMMCFINISHPEWSEQCMLEDTAPGVDVAAGCAEINDEMTTQKEEMIAEGIDAARLVYCGEYNHERDQERSAHRFPDELPVLYCMRDEEGRFPQSCYVNYVAYDVAEPIKEYCKRFYDRNVKALQEKKRKRDNRSVLTVCRAYNPDTDAGRL